MAVELIERELTGSIIESLYEDKVIVEVKASAVLDPTAHRQLLNYLTATGIEVGLLLHFGLTPKFERVVRSRRGRPREPALSASPASHPQV